MKNAVIMLLLASAVVFGCLYFRESRQTSKVAASADAAQQQVTELKSSLTEQEQESSKLQDRLTEVRSEAEMKVYAAKQEAEKLKASLTNGLNAAGEAETSAKSKSKKSNPLADMFKNPEMREMIKKQQKVAMGALIDKNYAALFQSLHLSPDQASQLKDLMLNKQLAAADAGMAMFAGDLDAEKRTEMSKQIKDSTDAANAQIKEFLGDENYTQLETYEKTLGERMAVSGFKDQLSSTTAPLGADQEQQLIQAMSEEKKNFKFSTDFSDKSKFNGDFASMFTEEKMNTYFQELDQLNQQYMSRVQNILNADQLDSFGRYLTNQQAMQKAGMEMAVKMFSPSKSDEK